MNNNFGKISRRLYAWEIVESQRVFGHKIYYERVRIHEGVNWLHWIQKLAVILKRTQPGSIPNAITLGNHCYFPIRLPSNHLASDHPDHYKISWLMHELTHVWQFQHMGWKYLFIAIFTQIRAGRSAYEFGGEAGLENRLKSGATFRDFNLEQQGDIIRSYYDRICKGSDVRAWDSFINDIREDDRINLV